MELNANVIELIKNDTETKTLLALALKKSIYRIEDYIKENSDNLTKAAALEVLRKQTGLTDEEILTETVTENH